MEPEDSDPARWLAVAADDVDWVVDADFLRSRWTCTWGRGCLGILDEPAPHLGQGCCSVGAELADADEARTTATLAALLDPARFQFHEAAAEGGVFADETATNTRVVEGACIFLNRPGFAGGAGCALHLGALDDGEAPMDWKPSVCWQLPIRVDWSEGDGGREQAVLRRWSRADWGVEGETMAWCCTEGDLAYVGDRPVAESLGAELAGVLGPDVLRTVLERLALPSSADEEVRE